MEDLREINMRHALEEAAAIIVFLAFMLFIMVAPAFCAETNDIDVKFNWSQPIHGPLPEATPEAKAVEQEKKDVVVSDKSLQALQPVPNVPAEAPKKAKKIGFWAKFHPDNIETYHPKLNKTWNGYMFVYEHGGRQTLDITAKIAQIAFPFVVN